MALSQEAAAATAARRREKCVCGSVPALCSSCWAPSRPKAASSASRVALYVLPLLPRAIARSTRCWTRCEPAASANAHVLPSVSSHKEPASRVPTRRGALKARAQNVQACLQAVAALPRTQDAAIFSPLRRWLDSAFDQSSTLTDRSRSTLGACGMHVGSLVHAGTNGLAGRGQPFSDKALGNNIESTSHENVLMVWFAPQSRCRNERQDTASRRQAAAT